MRGTKDEGCEGLLRKVPRAPQNLLENDDLSGSSRAGGTRCVPSPTFPCGRKPRYALRTVYDFSLRAVRHRPHLLRKIGKVGAARICFAKSEKIADPYRFSCHVRPPKPRGQSLRHFLAKMPPPFTQGRHGSDIAPHLPKITKGRPRGCMR